MCLFRSTRLILAAASSLLLSCGESADAGTADAGTADAGTADAVASDALDTDAAPVCPLNATTCGPECMTVTGSEWDSAQECLSVNSTIVGCWSTLSPRLADDVCLRRKSDGLLIRGKGSNRYDTAVWEPCEATLAEEVVTGEFCQDDSPSGCPASATDCPDGCGDILAHPWNAELMCINTSITVGCWPLLEPTTGDMKCMKRRSDGALFHATTGSLLAARPEAWEACDAATESAMSAAPNCPN